LVKAEQIIRLASIMFGEPAPTQKINAAFHAFVIRGSAEILAAALQAATQGPPTCIPAHTGQHSIPVHRAALIESHAAES